MTSDKIREWATSSELRTLAEYDDILMLAVRTRKRYSAQRAKLMNAIRNRAAYQINVKGKTAP